MKEESMNVPGLRGYEIREILHNGMRSRIYRGRRLEDNTPVIIKTHNEEFPDQSKVEQLIQEFEFGHRLNNACVNQYISIEKVGSGVALIAEDIDGKPLNFLMKEEKFTITDFLSIGSSICEGLAAIHADEIIHKDINPSNIILNRKTGQLKIIDFDISTELVQQNINPKHPDLLEGRLHYISPEQTGRMNRKIDYRSDLYSMGAIFYELLTGKPPFDTSDTMEIIHCHLARPPISVHELNPGVPKILSDIVMRLLLKTAEERYQTAWGVKEDLQKCLSQLTKSGEIKPFAIGEEDFTDRFQIPQKLYGREEEKKHLLDIFEQVSKGENRTLLITGYAGVGKSSLIHEIHKPITKKKALYIEGKFDQHQRNIPYFAISKAFAELVSLLLAESENVLEQYRQKIFATVSAIGKVLTDVIPELEYIIGKQPDIIELGGQEAQNRFNILFQKFVKVIASKEQPLVLFLDDLQWIDSASLNLLKLLSLSSDIRGILIIGAYRNNEVDETSPLAICLNEIQKEKETLETIELKDLPQKEVNNLVSDSLHCQPTSCLPLSNLIHSKTSGNAFFVHQTLQILAREKLIFFDFDQRQWRWDIEQIQEKKVTDNVVELMIRKLHLLPRSTGRVLSLASCIGNSFDLETVHLISEQSIEETRKALWGAVRDQKIFQVGDKYRFAHDRIQQAAYLMVPENEREAFHLRIGQLLLEKIPEELHQSRIYDIVNQLNSGRRILKGKEIEKKLIELNLMAGIQAKEEAAYESAVLYLKVALETLRSDSWECDYQITFKLYTLLAECEFLIHHQEESDRLFDIAFSNAKTNLERSEIHLARNINYISIHKLPESIEEGKKGMRLCGVEFPDSEEEIMQMIALEREKSKKVSIDDLWNTPDMTDPEKIVAMKIFPNLAMSAYLLNQGDLFELSVLKSLDFILQHGKSDFSAMMCSWTGSLLSGKGFYKEGGDFGLFSLKLADSRIHSKQQALVNNLTGICSLHFRRNIQEAISLLIRGYEIGLEEGDIFPALFCLVNSILHMLTKGLPLPQVLEQAEKGILASSKYNVPIALNYAYLHKKFVLFLMTGKPEHNLSDETSDPEFLEFTKNCHHLTFLTTYRLQIAFLFEDYTNALELAHEAEKSLALSPGYVTVVTFYLYYALLLIQLYEKEDREENKFHLKELERAKGKLKEWAEMCPENFEHHYQLILAEEARIFDHIGEAMELYEKAIASAQKNGFLQDTALANELAAKFYLAKKIDKIARVYMTTAVRYYSHWGAKAKLKALKKRYSNLFETTDIQNNDLAESSLDFSVTSLINLDLKTVLKTSRAISGEILLSSLLKKVMKIIIESAGAEKVFLIFKKGEQWVIEAEGSGNSEGAKVLQSIPVEESLLPETILHYVIRKRDKILLDDAGNQGQFVHDPYIMKNRTKSVLCMPLINQRKLSGILYLENSLSTHVFTSTRMELLDVLSSQMAISLDNARLYDETIKNAKLASQLAKAKLDVLRLQLNPHFLFNTLNMISSAMYDDIDQADKILTRLSDLLRQVLSRSKQQTVTLEEEFELFQHYVEIMEARFAEKLVVAISMDPECHSALFPGFIIQPIVENSIKHGMDFSVKVMTITIHVRKKGSRIQLTIQDNGIGLSDDPETLLTKGTGLSSNLERLELMYKGDFSFNLANSVQGGTIVSMEIPFQTKPPKTE